MNLLVVMQQVQVFLALVYYFFVLRRPDTFNLHLIPMPTFVNRKRKHAATVPAVLASHLCNERTTLLTASFLPDVSFWQKPRSEEWWQGLMVPHGTDEDFYESFRMDRYALLLACDLIQVDW